MLPSCLQSALKTITKLAFLLKLIPWVYIPHITDVLHAFLDIQVWLHFYLHSVMFQKLTVIRKRRDGPGERLWIQTVPGCWRSLHPGWIRKVQANIIKISVRIPVRISVTLNCEFLQHVCPGNGKPRPSLMINSVDKFNDNYLIQKRLNSGVEILSRTACTPAMHLGIFKWTFFFTCSANTRVVVTGALCKLQCSSTRTVSWGCSGCSPTAHLCCTFPSAFSSSGRPSGALQISFHPSLSLGSSEVGR